MTLLVPTLNKGKITLQALIGNLFQPSLEIDAPIGWVSITSW